MRSAALLTLLFAAAPAFPQPRTQERLNKLEKRVTRVEDRVTGLEGGAVPAAAEKRTGGAIAVYLLKKRQIVGQEKIGVKIYLEFENISNRRCYAFNGVLVFRDEAGAVIWKKPYGYSDPLPPGRRAQVVLAVSSDQAREYLKFVKARSVTVSLEKQKAYGVD